MSWTRIKTLSLPFEITSSCKMAEQVHHRHVVAIGKTGCGKSSVANRILGRDYFDVRASLYSVTKHVEHNTTDFTKDGVKYYVNVYDTVGLFDTNMLSNQEIMKEVKEYANDNAKNGINLVLFIFRKGRYTPEEKEAFDFIVQRFGKQISAVCALVITHCDGDDKEARSALIEDFRSNPTTCDVANFMKKGIYTVGFPHKEKTLPIVYEALSGNMEKDIEQLHDLIANSHATVLSRELYDPSWWKRCQIL